MGINERKERERRELKSKIMSATAEILIKEGYEKTTIRKVASAIEYSPRTVYLYFRDKDALLMEIIEEGFAETLKKKNQIREQLDYSNPEEIFSIQIRNNIQIALTSPNLYKAIVYLIQYKAYPPGPNQRKVIDELREDIELCYKASGKEAGNSLLKTDLIFAYIRGFNLMIINQKGKLNVKLLEEYIQFCIHSILTGIIGIPG